ncbi:MAG: PhoH family protein [Candidatus Moraniibacteriota bacterium]
MASARKSSKGKGRNNGLRKPPAPRTVPSVVRFSQEDLVFGTRSVKGLRLQGEDQGKLFLLDTNVFLHDPSCMYRFENNDVFLCIYTMEELDNHKRGNLEINRNARLVSKMLDELTATKENGSFATGFSLAKVSSGIATGRLFIQTDYEEMAIPPGHQNGKVDNLIIAYTKHLQRKNPRRRVRLVSKDIYMRIKARANNVAVEDYKSDKVMEDTDLLYPGTLELPLDFWDKHGKGMESWKQGSHSYSRVSGSLVPTLLVNQFVYQELPKPFSAVVKELDGKTAVLQTTTNYTVDKNNVWGITARNREQNFALNLLMNPEIDFVSLSGQAGTGKTLLTIAAGLILTLEFKVYTEIIFTRVTVPVGEDIGFLPGTEEEKMNPWMGALDDNLDVLNGGNPTKHDNADPAWGRAATRDLIRSRIKVKSLNFMRGRTFLNKFVIIDEAQNLTPKQMKTLITRAGPGTKMVCLGNIAQIDTPYLTEGSSGLAYVVDRMKGWSHSGHVTLQRGERSRLADHAAEVL